MIASRLRVAQRFRALVLPGGDERGAGRQGCRGARGEGGRGGGIGQADRLGPVQRLRSGSIRSSVARVTQARPGLLRG